MYPVPVLWVRRLLMAAALAAATLGGTAVWAFRPPHVERVVTRTIADRLGLAASFESLSIRYLPHPRITGTGLTVRLPSRPDLPPFISVARFTVDVGWLDALRRHVRTVVADGLRVAVPPGSPASAATAGSGSESTGWLAGALIDHVTARDATLEFLPADRGAAPLVFAIRELAVDSVAFGRQMPFTATFVNPVPRGLVLAHGRVGPWQPSHATNLPLEGDFTLADAELAAINGLGGRVDATGRFKGVLTAIAVTGEATVREFSLDLGGRPAPLTATFDALVDGTDGTTLLRRVDAVLASTHLRVTGAISNRPGPGEHDVDVAVATSGGRVEDVLSLVLDSREPVLTGALTLSATIHLPPGDGRVRDRLAIVGRFGLDDASFGNGPVQDRIQELSRRSQGKDALPADDRVLSDLRGDLTLAAGQATLTQLSFRVPGADLTLDGTYGVATGGLDFRGTLRMQSSVSRAIGGFKSLFVKPFDALFRGRNAAAVLPIRISGTREAPRFSVAIGKALLGGG